MKSIKLAVLTTILAAGTYAGMVSAQDRTTVLREADGRTTVVNTNEKGTSTTQGGREVYQSRGDRHNDQVRDSMKDHGGKVVKDTPAGGGKSR